MHQIIIEPVLSRIKTISFKINEEQEKELEKFLLQFNIKKGFFIYQVVMQSLKIVKDDRKKMKDLIKEDSDKLKMKTVSIKLNVCEVKRFKEIAKRKNMSVSQFIYRLYKMGISKIK